MNFHRSAGALCAGTLWLALAVPAGAQAPAAPLAPVRARCQVDNDTDPVAVAAACEAALVAATPEARFDLIVARGYAQIRQQRYVEALADLDSALRISAQSAFVRHERAFALNALGRYDEALVELDAEEKLLPDSPRVAQERAFAHARLGDLAQARREWDRVVALSPDDARARLGRAAAALWTGDFAQVRADLALVAADRDPAVTAGHQVLSRRLALASARGPAPDALARCRAAPADAAGLVGDCTAAFLSEPNVGVRAEILGLRAAAWTAQGDLDQALEDSEIAVALYPPEPNAHAALAFRLLLAGRGPEALARFDQAVRLQPSAFALAGRARTRFELGDATGAAADARAANDQAPNDLAFIVLGDLAYRASDAAAARVAWLNAYRLGYRGADLVERLTRAGVTNPARDAGALR
ncbi:tetratricopeptide repeat protein [Phenylobacterium immobile]|uniref:tetratricopeptide repeat protein n=1 Tax=Phenylobacterium immobile TaxID=21 RepID=UPI000A7EE82A|nr:tetratricopeptide repeat protein [Phenylobacterium immobile]